MSENITVLIEQAEKNHQLSAEAIVSLLREPAAAEPLFAAADRVRKLYIGPQVELLFFKEKLEYIFSSEAMNALQVAMQSNRTSQQKDAA